MIDIRENYIYEGKVPLYFTRECCLFVNGKLVIESVDIKNKLIFVLILKMVRYRNNFLEYYKQNQDGHI